MASTLERPGPSAPLPPHLDPRPRHRRSGSLFAPYRLIGKALGVILAATLLLLSGWAWYTYRGINNGVHRLQVSGLGTAANGTTRFDGKDQNILLVGNDDRANLTRAQIGMLRVGGGQGSNSTDTMMIVHIPADGSTATLISLPRDSYVQIPGAGMNKLNSAYVFGYNNSFGTLDQKRAAGASVLIKTVSALTGLTIDHYVQVSLMGFYDLANALSGVTVDLCSSVNDTVAYNAAHGSDGGSDFVMSKGTHTLTALQSLEFVRQRHNLPNGDLDRVRRQQYFLAAAFRKVASVGVLFKLNALGDAVRRNLYMDPGLNLTDLAMQMENLSANNIVGKTIPFERFWNSSPVGSVEVVDPAHVQAFLKNLIKPAPKASATGASSAASRGATGSGSASKSGPKSAAAIDSKCIN